MSISGYNIFVCEAGTKITGKEGQELTVTESNAVICGSRMYVTPENNKRLIEKTFAAPFNTRPTGGSNHGE